MNVLRRSGKEVERLLSMFDKCTIYTVYNRDDYPPLCTLPNEWNSSRLYSPIQATSLLSSSNDYNNNHANILLTTTNNSHSSSNQQQQQVSYSSSPQHQQNSSPPSCVDGASSCSASPKQFLTTLTTKTRTLSKPFRFFKLNTRSCSNPSPSSSNNTLKWFFNDQ